MRLAVCTPAYGRYEVVKLFLAGVARFSEHLQPHQVHLYLGTDDLKHASLVDSRDDLNASVLPLPNRPLSTKWNAIIRKAFDDGADYILVIGSDDVIMPDMAYEYKAAMDAGVRVAGVDGFFMIEPATKRALTLRAAPKPAGSPGKIVFAGTGRILSRETVELLGVDLFPASPPVNKSLDFFMSAKLLQAGLIPIDRMFAHDGYISHSIIDVKTGENIWSFDNILGSGGRLLTPNEYELIVSKMPAEEAAIVREMEGT